MTELVCSTPQPHSSGQLRPVTLVTLWSHCHCTALTRGWVTTTWPLLCGPQCQASVASVSVSPICLGTHTTMYYSATSGHCLLSFYLNTSNTAIILIILCLSINTNIVCWYPLFHVPYHKGLTISSSSSNPACYELGLLVRMLILYLDIFS